MEVSVVGEALAGCPVNWRSESLVAPCSVLLVSVEALSLYAGLVVQDRLMDPVEEVSSPVGDPLRGLEAD